MAIAWTQLILGFGNRLKGGMKSDTVSDAQTFTSLLAEMASKPTRGVTHPQPKDEPTAPEETPNLTEKDSRPDRTPPAEPTIQPAAVTSLIAAMAIPASQPAMPAPQAIVSPADSGGSASQTSVASGAGAVVQTMIGSSPHDVGIPLPTGLRGTTSPKETSIGSGFAPPVISRGDAAASRSTAFQVSQPTRPTVSQVSAVPAAFTESSPSMATAVSEPASVVAEPATASPQTISTPVEEAVQSKTASSPESKTTRPMPGSGQSQSAQIGPRALDERARGILGRLFHRVEVRLNSLATPASPTSDAMRSQQGAQTPAAAPTAVTAVLEPSAMESVAAQVLPQAAAATKTASSQTSTQATESVHVGPVSQTPASVDQQSLATPFEVETIARPPAATVQPAAGQRADRAERQVVPESGVPVFSGRDDRSAAPSQGPNSTPSGTGQPVTGRVDGGNPLDTPMTAQGVATVDLEPEPVPASFTPETQPIARESVATTAPEVPIHARLAATASTPPAETPLSPESRSMARSEQPAPYTAPMAERQPTAVPSAVSDHVEQDAPAMPSTAPVIDRETPAPPHIQPTRASAEPVETLAPMHVVQSQAPATDITQPIAAPVQVVGTAVTETPVSPSWPAEPQAMPAPEQRPASIPTAEASTGRAILDPAIRVGEQRANSPIATAAQPVTPEKTASAPRVTPAESIATGPAHPQAAQPRATGTTEVSPRMAAETPTQRAQGVAADSQKVQPHSTTPAEGIEPVETPQPRPLLDAASVVVTPADRPRPETAATVPSNRPVTQISPTVNPAETAVLPTVPDSGIAAPSRLAQPTTEARNTPVNTTPTMATASEKAADRPVEPEHQTKVQTDGQSNSTGSLAPSNTSDPQPIMPADRLGSTSGSPISAPTAAGREPETTTLTAPAISSLLAPMSDHEAPIPEIAPAPITPQPVQVGQATTASKNTEAIQAAGETVASVSEAMPTAALAAQDTETAVPAHLTTTSARLEQTDDRVGEPRRAQQTGTRRPASPASETVEQPKVPGQAAPVTETHTAANAAPVDISTATPKAGPTQADDTPKTAVKTHAETRAVPSAGTETAGMTAAAASTAHATVHQAVPTVAEVPSVVPSRFVDQVVKQIRVEVGEGKSEMTIRLDPPELGQIAVRLMTQGGVVTASFHAESESVRSLLQSNLPALHTALSDAGITLQQFTVSVGADSTAFQQRSAEHHDTPRRRPSSRRATPTAVHAVEAGRGRRVTTSVDYFA